MFSEDVNLPWPIYPTLPRGSCKFVVLEWKLLQPGYLALPSSGHALTPARGGARTPQDNDSIVFIVRNL
jgi:hypothetical protein